MKNKFLSQILKIINIVLYVRYFSINAKIFKKNDQLVFMISFNFKFNIKNEIISFKLMNNEFMKRRILLENIL
jgi:hypothetical protein